MNAKAFLEIQQSLAVSMNMSGASSRDEPSSASAGQSCSRKTVESDALSRDLIRRGFKFVGSTICTRSCRPLAW